VTRARKFRDCVQTTNPKNIFFIVGEREQSSRPYKSNEPPWAISSLLLSPSSTPPKTSNHVGPTHPYCHHLYGQVQAEEMSPGVQKVMPRRQDGYVSYNQIQLISIKTFNSTRTIPRTNATQTPTIRPHKSLSAHIIDCAPIFFRRHRFLTRAHHESNADFTFIL
jgi:hypothetical protein